MFKRADWTRLSLALNSVTWDFLFETQDPVEAFSLKVLELSKLYIPYESLLLSKGSYS